MTKIAGLLMAHSSPYTKMALDSMTKYCNAGIWVNCNEVHFESRKAVMRHPAVRDVIFTQNGGRWNQGKQRDNTLRILDKVEPDVVVWPDDDETYYQGFGDELQKFIDDELALTFWARLLYLWDDPQHFRNDGLYKKVHKVTAFKWRSGLTYIPYPGYTCPREYLNMPKETKMHATKPLPHWGYMDKEVRDKKAERGNCQPKTEDPLILEVPDGII